MLSDGINHTIEPVTSSTSSDSASNKEKHSVAPIDPSNIQQQESLSENQGEQFAISKFRIKQSPNNPRSIETEFDMNDFNTLSSNSLESRSDSNNHSYSCKRCRRLKKKCTKTIPECQNCLKAGENCEYVPRAPRRKKAEILRSIQEQYQLQAQTAQPQVQLPAHPPVQGHGQLQPQLPQVSTDLNENRSPLSPTPLLQTQDSLSGISNHMQNNTIPNIQINRIHQPTNTPPNLSSLASNPPDSYNQHAQQYQQQLSLLEHSPVSFNMGTADPFSYKSNNTTFGISSLPPLRSLTTKITTQQHQQEHFQHSPQNTTYYPHLSPPATRQGSDDSQYQTQLQFQQQQVQRSPLQSLLQNPLQNIILKSIVGIDDSALDTSPGLLNRPIIKQSLMIKLVERFFEDNYHSYPFLNKNQILKLISVTDLAKIDTMSSIKSFEIFMILLIGYCSLEKAGRITTDASVKKYISSKSIEKVTQVVSFDNFQSVKCLLLFGIYSLFDTSGFQSWHIAGYLTRLTLSLGLNRGMHLKIRELSSLEDQESRKRVFWSVYNFDRLVSISLGRPFGIDDDDINIPFPTKMNDNEESDSVYDVELITAIISLRQIEGKILKNIHSVNASNKVRTEKEKLDVLRMLRIEAEDWYNLTNGLTNHYDKNDLFNVSWFTANYYQLILLLYRPSFLIPNPPKDTLMVLGKACLQCLTYTYNLHTSHLLQPNWVAIYRFLTQCTTIIYCLCHWCIDLVESKTEINLCIEILESFGDRWTVSAKSALIFRQINKAIYEIKVNQNWELLDTEELTNKFYEGSRKYHDVLSSNNVDIWFDDPVISNSEQH